MHGLTRRLFLLGFTLAVTIQAAPVSFEQALTLLNSDQPPLEIEIEAGVVSLSEPIRLQRYYEQPLRVFSKGEGLKIQGGTAITGWQKGGPGQYHVVIPEDQPLPTALFVNDQRATLARHPNQGFFRIVQAAADNRTGFSFNAGDIPELSKPEDAHVFFMHDWSTSRVRVSTIDPEKYTLTVRDPIGCGAKHYAMTHFEKNPRYFLEGAREFLDAPGEWMVDAASRTVHYWAREDETTIKAVVPDLEQLLIAQGTPGQPAGNLHFENIQFTYSNWVPPENGYAAGQAAFHERRDGSVDHGLREFIPPAVHVTHAKDMSFKRCEFRNLGGSGLWIGGGCEAISIESCTFDQIAANGLMLGEGRTSEVSHHLVATKNVVQHCGTLYRGAVGIWGGILADTQITHNHIHHLPYTGISLGWSWNPRPTPAENNRISNNHIHHCMQVLSDGGGIYTLGRQPDSVLSENTIHDIPLNLGRAESNGMFLDEGTTGFTIEDNHIYNIDRSPLRFHKATTNLVRNNRLVCKPGEDPVRYNATDPKLIVLENNRVEYEQRPAFVKGVVGNAMNFDGKDFIEVPHQDALEADQLTISLWIKPDTLNGHQTDGRNWLIGKNQNEWEQGHYGLLTHGGGGLMAYINTGAGREHAVSLSTKPGMIQPKQWTQAALVLTPDQMKLYVNGKEAAARTLPAARSKNSLPLSIGRRPDGYTHFCGAMDELVMFNRALSGDEMHALYQKKIPASGAVYHQTFEHP